MIEIAIYRARIGGFAVALKPRTVKSKFGKYKGSHHGTDIHFRSFACNILLLIILLVTYGVLSCREYVLKNYALPFTYEVVEFPFPLSLATAVIITSNGHCVTNMFISCRPDFDCMANVTEGLYSSYFQRQLMLSADVELNPGPGSQITDDNTRIILEAINETKNGICDLKAEMKSARADLSNLKTEMNSINCKLRSLENMYGKLETRVKKMEKSSEELQFQQEVLENDMSCLSIRDEIKDKRLTNIERQLDIIESARLKCSLRIFGLEETEADETELKTIVERELLSVGENEEYTENTIASARRIGSKEENSENTRMVIAEFSNADDKFKLFKYRDVLREKGIKISNDISFMKRQKLKELRERGIIGYYKGDKLFTLKQPSDDNQGGIQTRVFKRATRPSERSARNHEDTGNLGNAVENMDTHNTNDNTCTREEEASSMD